MAKNINHFSKDLKAVHKDLKKLLQTAPRKVARMAQRHFEESFELQKYNEEGATAWEKRKYDNETSEGRNVLIGKQTAVLSKSIRVLSVSKDKIVIGTSLPYAKIHNEGGTISQNVEITDKMRKFFWAKYYKTKSSKYKAFALTKKTRFERQINIPQRQFLPINNKANKKLFLKINDFFKKNIDSAFRK